MLFRFAPVARIIGLLSLAVALAGCSAVKLGYNALPDLAYWWLDGYVDLDDAQGTRVRDELARLHAWHRQQELPRMLPLLQRLERMAGSDVTPAQVCALEPEIRERVQAVRQQLEPAVAALAPTLTPPQLQHLERKYAQNNRRYTREWVRLEPPALVDKRMEQITERAETVYGHLEEAQRTLLRQELQQSSFKPSTVLAERRRRQEDTLQVLRRLSAQPPSQAEALDAVRGVMDRFFASPDPGYRAHLQAQREEACRLIAALHNSATPAQREAASRRFRSWQRDFVDLASQQ